jgi:hypothetical protein
MENGWKLAGDNAGIILKKDNIQMCFDIHIETAKSVLWAICMKHKTLETVAVASVTSTPISIQQVHLRLGHMSEEATRPTAKALGWRRSVGSLMPCENCAIGKGRQKNLP